MKPLPILLAINFSLACLCLIFFWVLLDFPYAIPMVLGIMAMINLAASGIFFYGGETKMGLAFVAGFALLAVCALSAYGIMWQYFPEKLDYVKDLANPQ